MNKKILLFSILVFVFCFSFLVFFVGSKLAPTENIPAKSLTRLIGKTSINSFLGIKEVSAHPACVKDNPCSTEGEHCCTGGKLLECKVGLAVSVSSQLSGEVIGEVTWTATLTGGKAPYTYYWTGSDGLDITQVLNEKSYSITKHYSSEGDKTAACTVTDADGLSVGHSDTVAITFPDEFEAGHLEKSFWLKLNVFPPVIVASCWPTGLSSNPYGYYCSANNPAYCYPEFCNWVNCVPCPTYLPWYEAPQWNPCPWPIPGCCDYYEPDLCEEGCNLSFLVNRGGINYGYFRRTLSCPPNFELQLQSCVGKPCPFNGYIEHIPIDQTLGYGCDYKCVRQSPATPGTPFVFTDNPSINQWTDSKDCSLVGCCSGSTQKDPCDEGENCQCCPAVCPNGKCELKEMYGEANWCPQDCCKADCTSCSAVGMPDACPSDNTCHSDCHNRNGCAFRSGCDGEIPGNYICESSKKAICCEEDLQCSLDCGAECETNTGCNCLGVDNCVGNSFYDYPVYGACADDCTCNLGDGPGQPCEPTATDCNDGNVCTADSCDASGCRNDPRADGTDCGDCKECTSGSCEYYCEPGFVCQGGDCLPAIQAVTWHTYQAGDTVVAYPGLVPCGQEKPFWSCLNPVMANNKVVLDGNGYPTCNDGFRAIPCQLCHFLVMFKGIIDFVLFRIVPIVAVLMLVIGGAMFIFSAESPSLVSQGRSVMTAAAIGLIIIFAAWLIINLFFSLIGAADWTGLREGWFQIKCSIRL